MLFKDFEQIISEERLQRYVNACHGDTRKAMTLYRENLHLSQEMFTLISCFEVALRNAIDRKLRETMGDNWLRDAISEDGSFAHNAHISETCKIVRKVYERLKEQHKYTHSHLVSGMEFGIWKYMFSNPQYKATGRVLLKIFPNRPASSVEIQYNNAYIFNELDRINMIRNRIAHHEPICFKKGEDEISTYHTYQQYQRVQTLFSWMGIDAGALLYGLDHVRNVCKRIDNLA